jgi:hypothetical protein
MKMLKLVRCGKNLYWCCELLNQTCLPNANVNSLNFAHFFALPRAKVIFEARKTSCSPVCVLCVNPAAFEIGRVRALCKWLRPLRGVFPSSPLPRAEM